MESYTGCSGFHYKHWKGIFYPPRLPVRQWFEFYSSIFNALEINTTFYRFPTVAMLDKWYQISPPSFAFALKVPKAITHFKKFNDCDRMLADFYLLVDKGLKEKAKVIVFQLHPNWTYSPERLELLCSKVNMAFQNVFEFRHASWWNELVYLRLKQAKISFASISYPGLPNELTVTAPLFYRRFHGDPVLYTSSYPSEELVQTAMNTIRNQDIHEAFFFFNNDVNGSAFENAAYLKRILSELPFMEKFPRLGR